MEPNKQAESEVKKYVGGFIDVTLAKSLQDVADRTARGNRTMVFERYMREGLEREENPVVKKNFASRCLTPGVQLN